VSGLPAPAVVAVAAVAPTAPGAAAVLLAAAAVFLLVPHRSRRPRRPPALPGAPDGVGRQPVLRLLLPAVGAVAVLLAVLDGTRLVLALELVGCLVAAVDLVRRGRAFRAAERRRAAVVETAEALAGELRAGQPVLRALARTVEVWPPFAQVEAAARLGADVPAALRACAAMPGAEDLAQVAAAWQVSHESGAGLAAALAQVAATARARQATRHVVVSELASARATARMVALLPLAVLGMGSGLGGHPWHFLLATPPGLGCLAGGALTAFAGLHWIDRIAAGVLRP
jgi:tight adherence protein B